jgi:hypothetical protein
VNKGVTLEKELRAISFNARDLKLQVRIQAGGILGLKRKNRREYTKEEEKKKLNRFCPSHQHTFSNLFNYRKHLKRLHPEAQITTKVAKKRFKAVCDKCMSTFNQFKFFFRHKCEFKCGFQRGKGPKCTPCQQVFQSRVERAAHKRRHKQSCGKCKKKYNCEYLKRHKCK